MQTFRPQASLQHSGTALEVVGRESDDDALNSKACYHVSFVLLILIPAYVDHMPSIVL